jgi:hypothetical protein
MLAKYTVTQNGSSEGNVIAQPFGIEIHRMDYGSVTRAGVDDDGNPIEITEEGMSIVSCTKNGSDTPCDNDDIPQSKMYPLPAMGSSNNADLSAFESDLTAAYGANWSKDVL